MKKTESLQKIQTILKSVLLVIFAAFINAWVITSLIFTQTYPGLSLLSKDHQFLIILVPLFTTFLLGYSLEESTFVTGLILLFAHFFIVLTLIYIILISPGEGLGGTALIPPEYYAWAQRVTMINGLIMLPFTFVGYVIGYAIKTY